MKTIINILSILLVAMFLFSSCENTIEFKGKVTEPMLVVNSFVTPDSTVKVNLSQSKFFLDNENSGFEFIDNAEVYVWKNGIETEQLSAIGNGYYTGNFKPEIGDHICIRASNPTFSEVNCETEIVDPVAIISADTTNYNFYHSGYYMDGYITHMYTQESVDLSVRFKDAADITNYYRISAFVRNHYADGSYVDVYPNIYSDDLVFGSTEIELGGEESYFEEFSDKLFNGQEYKLKFLIELNCYFVDDINGEDYQYYQNHPLLIPQYRELCIDLQSLSKSYYLYLSSRSKYESASDIGMELFSEPVQIFSNVNGGIGILGAYSSSIYKIRLRDIPEEQ